MKLKKTETTLIKNTALNNLHRITQCHFCFCVNVVNYYIIHNTLFTRKQFITKNCQTLIPITELTLALVKRFQHYN